MDAEVPYELLSHFRFGRVPFRIPCLMLNMEHVVLDRIEQEFTALGCVCRRMNQSSSDCCGSRRIDRGAQKAEKAHAMLGFLRIISESAHGCRDNTYVLAWTQDWHLKCKKPRRHHLH